MNTKKIEEIIKLVKANDVKKFKYKDFENEIELDFTEGQVISQAPSVLQGPSSNSNQNAQQDTQSTDIQTEENAIKSPMVGTFFLQDSKELTEPQIKVGDKIEKGDVIGFIEAMKVMNEVTSDIAGEVANIAVEHGTNVEYDQILVTLK
ncbi:acetyl-CoA carboxylase biotin carboxyl carrier protein [Staphylococcus warneri]|uniref:acetyl-CoA carboxylase biotin carboxyl carrier protein n=1 Tax=Staphylococcus warneri TaxID=1292 RepID=UPI001FB2B32B|nr:biotin/lipoyl-containing protein [Staphylococcus warneri]MCJ1785871.1 acetyl-CoA carboxylase biotin carboxyl carrier protein subunit [Staphylococcus warneri]MCJ1789195.1 acetyl-CoA carboxylase biotin carboxyl carrier protein subunit [Staphylococcus warneri]MCJ1791623.1 acetyl-CoA carboxylase biotin carboxyl carrier protein subunit [Staphylococcus warneri]MCJ1794082.1 acetyl-CoA carboxylase biotin carboxyl carrier protein subunit [Staphylococcus warneri]MCJ1795701.1 acetyl-CoA carboxylase bi